MKALELKVYEILKNRFNDKDVFLTKQDKVDLIEKMNKDKVDLIKWMFVFWITIILLLLANWFLK